MKAKAFAKSIFIDSADGILKLSDNWFDMNAGEMRVQIIEGDSIGITLRSIYDIA
ncbi:MAG: hypothetical protein GX781_05720 [Clostridiales bacterium]|nr:hypothetical protein [Clostridiales bacterium]